MQLFIRKLFNKLVISLDNEFNISTKKVQPCNFSNNKFIFSECKSCNIKKYKSRYSRITTCLPLNKVRYFSQKSLVSSNLDPNFITGFSYAESSFMISILKNSERRVGWSVVLRFEITVHQRDEGILIQIHSYFKGVGRIIKSGDKVSYRVYHLEQIVANIIPHFQNYPLNTKKKGDF